MGEVLTYSTGRPKHLSQLRRLFARIWRALRPGGLFVFDLLVADRGPAMQYRTWRAGARWAVLVEVSEDRRRGEVYRDITTFRKAGAHYRRTRERHVVHVSSRTQIMGALRGAGFRVHTTRRYGSTALAPRRLVFWARKPA